MTAATADVTDATGNTARRVVAWLRARPHVVALAVIAVPLLVGLVAVAGDDWRPTGDFAYHALAVRDVPEDLPLLGAAGRFGPIENQRAHLGPAMTYALWPVTTLFGGSGTALMIATSLLHLGAVVAAVLVARRVGGVSYALAVATASAILLRALGPQFFLTPWNPFVPVLVFLAFLVLLHAVVSGHLRAAPFAVAAGTFCAQAHVGYMVLVHGLLAAALVYVLVAAWQRWPGFSWRGLLRPLGWAGAVGVLMWLPPLYEQVRRTGNLGWVIGRLTHPCDPRWWADECTQPVGLSPAVRAMATELNLGGAWISGATHDPSSSTPGIVGTLVVAAAVIVAIAVCVRGRDRLAGAGLAVAGAAALLGTVSAARILDDFYDYLIRWSWSIAAFGAAVVVWALWRSGAVTSGRARGWLTAGALGVVLAVSASAAVDATRVRPPEETDSRSVAGLAQPAVAQLDPDARYLLRWHDPLALGATGAGMLFELERAGFTVGTDAWTRWAVGEHRVMPESSATAMLWVVVGERSIAEFAARSDAVEVARFDPRTAPERERSAELHREIVDELIALGREDLAEAIDHQFGVAILIDAADELPDELDAAVVEYKVLRSAVALFVEPPGSPGFAPA